MPKSPERHYDDPAVVLDLSESDDDNDDDNDASYAFEPIVGGNYIPLEDKDTQKPPSTDEVSQSKAQLLKRPSRPLSIDIPSCDSVEVITNCWLCSDILARSD